MDKKNRVQVLTLALCAVLLGLNLWQLRRISDLRGQLQSVETNLQTETRRLDERVQAVQRAAREADALVQDWKIISAEPDRASRSLRAEVSLSLKEWREDTAAELLWIGDGGSVGEGSAPLTGDGKGAFTGVLEIPLDRGLLEFGLNLVIRDGEGQRRENLGVVYGTDELLPVQCIGWGSGGPYYTRDKDQNGALTVTGCEAELIGLEGRPALPQLSGQAFRLRRNGDVAAEKTAMYGETIGQYTCEELSSEARIGDEFSLTFFCRDESGLGYEFFLNGWKIDENGIKDAVAPTTDWPRLSWD